MLFKKTQKEFTSRYSIDESIERIRDEFKSEFEREGLPDELKVVQLEIRRAVCILDHRRGAEFMTGSRKVAPGGGIFASLQKAAEKRNNKIECGCLRLNMGLGGFSQMV